MSDATLQQWRKVYHEQGYAALAFEILSLYIDDIPADDLRALCAKTYTAEVFGTGEIVPLRHLEDGVWIEALSNGPTLAFKDMAMQLLGNLFEYELGRRGEELNILGATSGDTGSAAEYAMRGKKGVRVFMTSPNGRMSPFQQAQMFSLQDANIHNIASQRRVRRLPGHRQGRLQRPGLQAQVQDRHRQLHQLGTLAGASGLLLCRLHPGHREEFAEGQLCRAIWQLRQRLRRPCRPR